MHRHRKLLAPLLLFFFISSFWVLTKVQASHTSSKSLARESLFTPKSSLISYLNKRIQNNLPKPLFLISKSSPLTNVESATFVKLASENSLSSHLSTFCSSANLLCFNDLYSSLENYELHEPVFQVYYIWATQNGIKTSSVIDDSVTRWVESGIFFRESMLKPGTLMLMPEIKDKTPKRSFLPRSISSKLPFSITKLKELNKIFHVNENSSMERMMKTALTLCESPPGPRETKQCVGSAEDMIDFAILILGKNVVTHTTDSVKGLNLNQKVMIKNIRRINGGKVSKWVSCHQLLYPYLLYYCHSALKARVYELDIFDPSTETQINHSVAICHMDTSLWNPSHAAFLSLGSGPGKIEVCHWVFENGVIWTNVD